MRAIGVLLPWLLFPITVSLLITLLLEVTDKPQVIQPLWVNEQRAVELCPLLFAWRLVELMLAVTASSTVRVAQLL